MATMHGAGDAGPNDPSLSDLAKGVAQDASRLVWQEIELAKLELQGKARTAAPVVVLTTWLAALVVTAFWAVVAGALGLVGRTVTAQGGRKSGPRANDGQRSGGRRRGEERSSVRNW